jgi:hypothetical protein
MVGFNCRNLDKLGWPREKTFQVVGERNKFASTPELVEVCHAKYRVKLRQEALSFFRHDTHLPFYFCNVLLIFFVNI